MRDRWGPVLGKHQLFTHKLEPLELDGLYFVSCYDSNKIFTNFLARITRVLVLIFSSGYKHTAHAPSTYVL